jgi:ribonuclease HI
MHLLSNSISSIYYIQQGFGWIFIKDETPLISFKGFSLGWASSTRMELLAVITAISTLPHHSTVDIYTDNQNIINTATSEYHLLTTRKRFKQTNFLLWAVYFKLITTLHLTVYFHKVKAHDSDFWNNTADRLANEGIHEGNILIDDKLFTNDVTANFFNINIDTNIRRFLKDIFTVKNDIKFENLNRVQSILKSTKDDN